MLSNIWWNRIIQNLIIESPYPVPGMVLDLYIPVVVLQAYTSKIFNIQSFNSIIVILCVSQLTFVLQLPTRTLRANLTFLINSKSTTNSCIKNYFLHKYQINYYKPYDVPFHIKLFKQKKCLNLKRNPPHAVLHLHPLNHLSKKLRNLDNVPHIPVMKK